MPIKRSRTVKSKTRKRRKPQRGGYLKENDRIQLRENDRNQFRENNLPPAYVAEQRGILKNIPKFNAPIVPVVVHQPVMHDPYRVTGKVPLFDRVNGFLKRTKIASKTARALGAHKIADALVDRGYGLVRPKRRRAKKSRTTKSRRKTRK